MKEKQSNSKIILIIIGVFIILGVIGVYFYSNNEIPKQKETKNTLSHNLGTIEKKHVKRDSNKPSKKILKDIKTSTNKSTDNKNPKKLAPVKLGMKERPSPILQKDEYYLEEYTIDRIKGTRVLPVKVDNNSKNIKWHLKLNGSACGAPLIYNDTLYFGCYDYQALAIDAKTGDVVFQAKTWSQAVGNTKRHGNKIIVPQRNGNITAYDYRTGKRIWNHRSAVFKKDGELDLSISGIEISGNTMLVSKHWGNLYMVDVNTGIMMMDPGVPYESRINLPAITIDNNIVYCNVAGEMLCFSKDGKTQRWKHTIEQGYPISMVAYKNNIIYANTERELVYLDTKTKKQLWKIKLPSYSYNSIKIVNNNLYIGAGNLMKIDIKNGNIIWEVKSNNQNGFCRGIPVVKNGVVYAAEQEGRVCAVDAKNGDVLKSVMVEGEIWNGLAVNSGLVYVGTTNKDLICLDFN